MVKYTEYMYSDWAYVLMPEKASYQLSMYSICYIKRLVGLHLDFEVMGDGGRRLCDGPVHLAGVVPRVARVRPIH